MLHQFSPSINFLVFLQQKKASHNQTHPSEPLHPRRFPSRYTVIWHFGCWFWWTFECGRVDLWINEHAWACHQRCQPGCLDFCCVFFFWGGGKLFYLLGRGFGDFFLERFLRKNNHPKFGFKLIRYQIFSSGEKLTKGIIWKSQGLQFTVFFLPPLFFFRWQPKLLVFFFKFVGRFWESGDIIAMSLKVRYVSQLLETLTNAELPRDSRKLRDRKCWKIGSSLKENVTSYHVPDYTFKIGRWLEDARKILWRWWTC